MLRCPANTPPATRSRPMASCTWNRSAQMSLLCVGTASHTAVSPFMAPTDARATSRYRDPSPGFLVGTQLFHSYLILDESNPASLSTISMNFDSLYSSDPDNCIVKGPQIFQRACYKLCSKGYMHSLKTYSSHGLTNHLLQDQSLQWPYLIYSCGRREAGSAVGHDESPAGPPSQGQAAVPCLEYPRSDTPVAQCEASINEQRPSANPPFHMHAYLLFCLATMAR